MNRKEFFKKLGLGALVVAVAPKVLAEKEESGYEKGMKEYAKFCGNVNREFPSLSYKDAQLIADEDLKIRMSFFSYGEGDYYKYMKDMGFILPDKL